MEALEQLLASARRGDLAGLAFAAITRKQTYWVDTAGDACRNPTFALGCVNVLAATMTRTIFEGAEL